MASSATAANTVHESLLPQPPTPPRDTHSDTHSSRRPVPTRSPFGPRVQLSTPPNLTSPLSTGATNSLATSKRTRKKVEWSAHTEYKDPPQYLKVNKTYKASPLSASHSASKPIKGILKPSSSPNPLASSLHGDLDNLPDQINMAEMLDSTIRQLAGSDRDSRLDAYMMLARALKASNNLPDRVALQDKMSLFMQFIQRDIKAKTEAGTSDTSLINHALNLLATFLHFQAIASTLTSDFGVFIIDHCIRCFDDETVHKDLVRHLMQVVAFQSFSPKVMTLDRVGRLVDSLHRIEDRLTGKSIVMGRIQIYKRLIARSRNHMAIHPDWMMDMFTDMLSTIRDIRAQAISLANEAGFSLRHEKQILRKASEIFQSTSDGNQTYIELFMKKLEDMLKDKQSPSTTPQIWGAVTLFLRCPLDRWQYFNNWLTLAQSAFNSTDWETKYEANYAWNRYVCLSLTDAKVVPKGLSLMYQPLLSQLRRKASNEEGVKLRRIVFGGLCNLYYYAFRPGPDISLIDAFWDIALQPVMLQLILPDGKPEPQGDSLVQASRILTGLLDVSTPRNWREDRVRDMPLVPPEELPAIDAKWTRRNCDKVFKLVRPILERKFTDLANKESLAYRLWQALTAAIAAASAKDIKVSDDTAKFFSCTFGLLHKVWSRGSLESDGSSNPKFLPSIKNYLHLLVKNLGLHPFTEKKLSMNINNTFEPAATPSHRSDRADKLRGVVQAPVYHLFLMLCSTPPGENDDENLCSFFQSVFEPFFNDKGSKIRVELIREMLRLLPQDALSTYGPWVLASNNMRVTLENMVSSSNPTSSERLLGPEYREVVSLLERGLLSHPNLPSRYWMSMFDFLSDHIMQNCGDAGRALGLVEPISKIILENYFKNNAKPNSLALEVTVVLFTVAKLPRDRQAVEAARRRLWGAPPTHSRSSSSFDPFDNLYKLQEQSMKYLYDSSDTDNEADIARYFDAVTNFLMTSFSETGVRILSKLQDGCCPWVQDEKARMALTDESPIPTAMRGFWNVVCRHLASLGRLENKDLILIEPLITAAFKSKHRYIVNKMAEIWNELHKDEDSLDCSDSLKAIIIALRPMVDVSFPGMENSSGEFGAQAQSFIESQHDLSFVAHSSTKSFRNEAEHPTPSASPLPKVTTTGRLTRKRHRDATPDTKQLRVSKRTSTPRLRHDNSQIRFEPIATSSPLAADESQHLTERQKEVRQRQQENAGIYTDIRSSPRTRSMAALEEKAKMSAESIRTRHQQSTPERPSSYGEFISSTPTPRRGQALQIEGYADPASSPPEPRSNPLLKEIQTRSRGKSSFESWEFSSPPGTPPITRQQRNTKFPRATPSGRATRRSRRRGAKSKSPIDAEVIPSSIAEEEVESRAADEREEPEAPEEPVLEPPSTPPREAPPDDNAQDTPKSADDEYVDARSSPEEPTQESRVEESRSEVSDCEMRDSSFELSEIDESGMMKLVVELESKNRESPVLENLPQKEECIMVHTDESSPAKEEVRSMKRSPSPVIPSTPAQAESEASQSQSQKGKKRKRPSMVPERRSKRRRSGGNTLQEDQDVQEQPKPMPVQEMESPGPTTRRSSRRNAGPKGKKQQDKETQPPVAEPPKAKETEPSDPAAEVRDGGDTDEELLSQLVTESKAASQTHSQDDVDGEAGPRASADVMDVEVAEREAPGQQPQKYAETSHPGLEGDEEAKAQTVMDILRGGLKELRGAALSRDQVYQLEDMLMDMKRELFEAERRGRE
ncbi:Rap1-interacting factor 1 N terminal-domain-containing protein [Mariannaea sp. PMI_226]|nr:Rap1-interacting factor 1 N terminal-domain-containing protein [Mariannaea sp. PMI_226]